jgi:hypothetical protein
VQVRTGEVGALPVAVKPKLVEPPASRLPLQPASVPITFAPLCESVAFHALPTVCPSANAHPAVHPLIEDEPVLRTVTFP